MTRFQAALLAAALLAAPAGASVQDGPEPGYDARYGIVLPRPEIGRAHV